MRWARLVSGRPPPAAGPGGPDGPLHPGRRLGTEQGALIQYLAGRKAQKVVLRPPRPPVLAPHRLARRQGGVALGLFSTDPRPAQWAERRLL